MTLPNNNRRVLVTGGTFLGDQIAAALLGEGAEVTMLLRAEAVERLGPLRARVAWHVADVWNPASLRGRARGHSCVIHTVGSMSEDTVLGLNHHHLNFVCARNVTNMCVSDGVQHLVFLSGVSAPWVHPGYIRAKREAENYIGRMGLQASIVRAPLAFPRRAPRDLFFRLLSVLGWPPLSWTPLGNIAPLPVDVLARGVARLVLQPKRQRILFHAADLRRLNSAEERRGAPRTQPPRPPQAAQAAPPSDFMRVSEDAPFGWMPTDDER
jgi:uncharacterized protein YbjT (DUF2867 family)